MPFENPNTAYFTTTDNKEELFDIDNFASNYFSEDIKNDTTLERAIYSSGGTISDSNLDKKGSVCIENVTYKDTLRHFEFIELLQTFFNSKRLLTATNLSKEEEKLKKKLLIIFCKLNWGARDNWTQNKLLRPMEERIFLIQHLL